MEFVAGDILQTVAIVGSALGAMGAGIWFGGRWTAAIEKRIDHVAAEVGVSRQTNTTEHATIYNRIDEHGNRIASIEDHLRGME